MGNYVGITIPPSWGTNRMLNTEKAILRVDRLFYAVEDDDRRVAARNVGLGTAFPIRVRYYGTTRPGLIPIACATGAIAGLAIVYSNKELFAIGTEPSLIRWQWPYSMKALDEAIDLLGPLDTKFKKVHAVRNWRVPLLKIQHKVVEQYPGLRVKREGGPLPGEPEVLLRPYNGGQLLGGCVWTPEYYKSGQAAKDYACFRKQSAP